MPKTREGYAIKMELSPHFFIFLNGLFSQISAILNNYALIFTMFTAVMVSDMTAEELSSKPSRVSNLFLVDMLFLQDD